jgi:hypothetical protein
VRSRRAKRLWKTTVCAECEVQRSGVPGGCERNVRGIVDGITAVITQTVVRLVTLRYERGRRSIRLKRGHDAAHQHAGQREGQPANGNGMAAGVRTVSASAARMSGPVDPARAQLHGGENEQGAYAPVDHVRAVARALHPRAASQPAASARWVSSRVWGSRRTPGSRPDPCTSARTRGISHVLRISHRGLAAREPSLNGGRREVQGGRVRRAEVRNVEAPRRA